MVLMPLTPKQDELRGMTSGLVATDAFAKQHFTLRSDEPQVLQAALGWLHDRNPWFAAYRASLQDVQEIQTVCETLRREGRLVAGGLNAAQTDRDEPLADALGEEPVALFVPQDDFKATTGSYQHLRAAADAIGVLL